MGASLGLSPANTHVARAKKAILQKRRPLGGLPIEERKAKLEALLKKPPVVIRYSVSFAKDIEELLSRICRSPWTERPIQRLSFSDGTALKSSADDPSGEIRQAQWKNESGPYSRVALLLNEIGTSAS
jgi:hypothetical protein